MRVSLWLSSCPSFCLAAPMDRRTHRVRLARALLLLFFLWLELSPLQCQGTKVARFLSSESLSTSSPSHFNFGLKRVLVSIVLGVLTGLVGAALFVCLVHFVVLFMNRTPIVKGPVIFSLRISPATLQSALDSENQLIGLSPNGKYYKTALDNGLTVAVKKLEPFEIGSPERQSKTVKRRIQRELEILASLRHRNLMSLRAYVREADRFSLVYDYMPSRDLEDALRKVRENQVQLGWDVRLRIAVGVIKGLCYLHCECATQILHYNLKPSNVMLDAEFEPRLSDSGLAMLMPNLVRSSSPYTAPECFQGSRYTDKSEIFSFGMILAVLLTGRDPAEPFFKETATGGSLAHWLRHLQQEGEAREALDQKLLGEEVEEDEMLMALRIAVVCLSELPADRPCSDELVPMLSQLHSF